MRSHGRTASGASESQRLAAQAFDHTGGSDRRALVDVFDERLRVDGQPVGGNHGCLRARSRVLSSQAEAEEVSSDDVVSRVVGLCLATGLPASAAHAQLAAGVDVVGLRSWQLPPATLTEADNGVVKVKQRKTADCVVVGLRPGKETGTVGSLILGLYERGKLRAGNVVRGPAIVTEMDSTTLVLPHHAATVHPSGSLLIRPLEPNTED